MLPLRSVVAAALLGGVVVTSVAAGAGRLRDVAWLARELGRLPDVEERRVALFGGWYVRVQELRQRIPPEASVDLVMLTPAARDIAVLASGELQPRDVRLFDGWEAWRRRTRAELLHDARAANAVAGVATGPASFVVAVDPAEEPVLRIVAKNQ